MLRAITPLLTAFFLGCAAMSSAQTCPTTPVTSYPFFESFDGFGATNGGTTAPPDWMQDTADATGANADWFFRNTGTTSTNTGPPSDHTTGVVGGGFYAHVDDSSPGNYPMVNLLTPCLDLGQLSFPLLTFWMHSNNNATPSTANENFLSVDVLGYPGPTLAMDVFGPVGHIGQQWTFVQADLTPFQGQIVQLRFRGRSDGGSFTHDIAIDDVMVSDGQPVDLALSSVDAPTSPTTCGVLLTQTETVTVTVDSFGLVSLPVGTVVTLSFSVDGGPPVTEMLALPTAVAPFTSFQYTFTGTADLSMPGPHTLTATVDVGDPVTANDTLSETISGGTPMLVTTFPFVESFELFTTMSGGTTPPPCWVQDQADGVGADSDWVFANVPPSSGNGPPSDHTTGTAGQGYFAFVEDDGNFQQVNLATPQLDASAMANPALRFWLHSNNASSPTTNFENFISLDVIDVTNGMTVPDVMPPTGHLGNMWVEQLVSLAQFQTSTIRLRFRASSDGGSATHDIAIDDVEVFDAPQSGGQAPQVGAAIMDINGARTAAGFPLAPAQNGPYFASATAGGPFSYSFEGEPSQAIIVLFGSLNPANAGFPGVGQIDIGGPVNPVTGFPTGISVLANGTNPTGVDVFFKLSPSGRALITFTTPVLPMGVLGTFQAAIYNSSTIVRISNAVEMTIN